MTIKASASNVLSITLDMLSAWATSPDAPVALHVKQILEPVEQDKRTVIFPPTYADIGYNIDTLSDGTKVATIDSVGSQANRLEPLFIAANEGNPQNALSSLVPQIKIKLPRKDSSAPATVSIFEVAHRSADAVVQSTPVLKDAVAKAFNALKETGDAGPLCALVPTSLIFGVWDSRGASGEKRPRLIRSVIRAWNVDQICSASQFNSIWKQLGEAEQKELEAAAKSAKVKLSEKGFADAPSTFRKTDATKYLSDGSPNPVARVLGGIVVHDRIERDITINLVALRGIRGRDDKETKQIQQYLLGLSLLAAVTDIDLSLREGCNLRYAGDESWKAVPRRGEPFAVALATKEARELLLKFTEAHATHFRAKWPEVLAYEFNVKEAGKLLAKKDKNAAEAELTCPAS